MVLVNPTLLREYFELLINAYRLVDDGPLLVHWLREDWGLFHHPNMNDGTAKDLLAEILNDGEIVRKSFLPLARRNTDHLGQWEMLRTELMSRNRFFPEADIDLDRLEQLLTFLTVGEEEIPRHWNRARIQSRELPFVLGEMGAPPSRIASNGRANPAGISYLYLASDADTAISEVRPQTGDHIGVAKFVIPIPPKLVDLRNPKRMVSPFLLEDAEDILSLRNDLSWLEGLGEELTRPVLPHAAAIDYTPSQYLCEYIKRCGYDGVLYKSSVGNGMNLALFSPYRAEGRSVAHYRVDQVAIKSRQVEPE